MEMNSDRVKYVGFVIDKAQNYAICSSNTFKRDATKPTCTLSGDSTTWVKTNRTIKWGCEDPLDPDNNAVHSGCNPSFSGSSHEYTSTIKTDFIDEYTIKDKAGNSVKCQSQTVNVYVDKTAPSCTNSGDSTTWTTSDRTIYYGCSDDDSGCDPKHSGGSVLFNRTTTTATIDKYTIKREKLRINNR